MSKWIQLIIVVVGSNLFYQITTFFLRKYKLRKREEELEKERIETISERSQALHFLRNDIWENGLLCFLDHPKKWVAYRSEIDDEDHLFPLEWLDTNTSLSEIDQLTKRYNTIWEAAELLHGLKVSSCYLPPQEWNKASEEFREILGSLNLTLDFFKTSEEELDAFRQKNKMVMAQRYHEIIHERLKDIAGLYHEIALTIEKCSLGAISIKLEPGDETIFSNLKKALGDKL